jgi:hypothetical protein
MSKEWKAPQAFEEGDCPDIELKPVDSNKVKAIGYCPVTKTLAVAFSTGSAVYHYPDVTPEQHEAFVNAESIGRHFGQHFQAAPFKKYRAPEAKPATV